MLPAPRLRVVLLGLAAAVLLAGCGGASSGAADDERDVVASIYPLAWVTERVAGDRWTVTNLTTAGGEPHDLELSISATAALAGADLVVYLEDFQPVVDDGVAHNAEGAILEVGDVVELQEVTDHTEAGHADEDEHSEESESAEDSHSHGDLDPHFWQDPARVADLARTVAEELGSLDAQGAEQYRDNAAQLARELAALDRAYAEGLASCERDTVVVSHDAFGYLEKYGIHLEPIAGLSPDAEPTPAALAALGDVIRDEGLTTVFSERLASPAMAQTLAADLDLHTDVLDPVEGLTDETADKDYLSLMRENLAALRAANGC